MVSGEMKNKGPNVLGYLGATCLHENSIRRWVVENSVDRVEARIEAESCIDQAILTNRVRMPLWTSNLQAYRNTWVFIVCLNY